MKVYDKEAWWQECRRHKPDLTRRDFETRWDAVWTLAKLFGAAVEARDPF